ncbi:hypothetical protein Scep_008925 [Stephania cephalantha]|uniref:Uncharacterized protein n=1 Tax=Stephania cephalantha TaxID=152367 RepID=A0AAP0JSQ7_9MAGN
MNSIIPNIFFCIQFIMINSSIYDTHASQGLEVLGRAIQSSQGSLLERCRSRICEFNMDVSDRRGNTGGSNRPSDPPTCFTSIVNLKRNNGFLFYFLDKEITDILTSYENLKSNQLLMQHWHEVNRKQEIYLKHSCRVLFSERNFCIGINCSRLIKGAEADL